MPFVRQTGAIYRGGGHNLKSGSSITHKRNRSTHLSQQTWMIPLKVPHYLFGAICFWFTRGNSGVQETLWSKVIQSAVGDFWHKSSLCISTPCRRNFANLREGGLGCESNPWLGLDFWLVRERSSARHPDWLVGPVQTEVQLWCFENVASRYLELASFTWVCSNERTMRTLARVRVITVCSKNENQNPKESPPVIKVKYEGTLFSTPTIHIEKSEVANCPCSYWYQNTCHSKNKGRRGNIWNICWRQILNALEKG
jgi:hypothetical protein